MLAIFISFCELLISFAQFSIRFLDIVLSILKEFFLLEILPFIPDKCYEYIPQMSLSFNFTYDDFFSVQKFSIYLYGVKLITPNFYCFSLWDHSHKPFLPSGEREFTPVCIQRVHAFTFPHQTTGPLGLDCCIWGEVWI